MPFSLGVCRYDLGDAHETIAMMNGILFLCTQGKIKEARAHAEAAKQHIAASPDLRGRPYIVRRFYEIVDIVERAERKRELV